MEHWFDDLSKAAAGSGMSRRQLLRAALGATIGGVLGLRLRGTADAAYGYGSIELGYPCIQGRSNCVAGGCNIPSASSPTGYICGCDVDTTACGSFCCDSDEICQFGQCVEAESLLCRGYGALCTSGAECCSGVCEENIILGGYGDKYCCQSTGQACLADSQCCGLLTCDGGYCGGIGCSGNGQYCISTNDCCGSLTCISNTCTSSTCLSVRALCSSGTQCCSGYCEQNINVGVAGNAYCCLPSGSVCSGNNDCCAPLTCVGQLCVADPAPTRAARLVP